jgi:hypothetical protein
MEFSISMTFKKRLLSKTQKLKSMKSLLCLSFFLFVQFGFLKAQTNTTITPKLKPSHAGLKTTGLIFTGIGAALTVGGAVLILDEVAFGSHYTQNRLIKYDPLTKIVYGASMLLNGGILTTLGLIMTTVAQNKTDNEEKKGLSLYITPVSVGLAYKF